MDRTDLCPFQIITLIAAALLHPDLTYGRLFRKVMVMYANAQLFSQVAVIRARFDRTSACCHDGPWVCDNNTLVFKLNDDLKT